ncbi:MAG: hypothetical protein M3Z15_13225 [Pseudomonadota bacterium]|nr:hypothetical protein [Pseudomonadota bacterium]
MSKTRLTALLCLAALVAPSLASANCYSIYDTKNRLAFQSSVAPIDLSTRISDSMRARFPGGHLIMIPDDSGCREYRTGPTLSPRFDAGGAKGAEPNPEQMLQAPLLRGAGTVGGDSPTRESVRSGNTLNIKRP